MPSVLAPLLDCVVGAIETAQGPSGAVFHRTPATGRALLGEPRFDQMSATTSGVRIEALTDAPEIELDVRLTVRLPRGTRPEGGGAFDAVVDGRLHEPEVVDTATVVVVDPATGAEVERREADPVTVRFDLGRADGPRRVEIWFPASAALELIDARVPEGASLEPAPGGGPLWVHHGSSISQCSEAERPTATWPAIVARRSGHSLLNLGLGGQCHLDQFMARTIRDLPADTISLELGINVVNGDTMRLRTFVPAFHGFLDTVRDGHPETPILVVTPIVCPAAEDRPGPTLLGPDGRVRTVDRPEPLADGALSLGRIRELLHHHAAVRRESGDTRLHVVDGLDLFGPGDASALPDGLHPDTDGYRRMAERFLDRALPVPR
ncbi:SGNH/GDSL hydrolase family protein [Nocardiopsis sp. LOL_012]|uniref:SGNH/GDSL hydrolase family protein n=1 Tax=Nocardiopsis sp. LOL_012 TaxID=3345409 RepID=UPI003A864102